MKFRFAIDRLALFWLPRLALIHSSIHHGHLSKPTAGRVNSRITKDLGRKFVGQTLHLFANLHTKCEIYIPTFAMEAEPAHQADLTANVTPGSDSNPAPNPGVGEAPTAGRSTTPVNRAEITHQPRILSLDGGGVRGISALVILEEIMKEVRRRENLKDVPLPCDYFDLIGGTSTGGLIAIMLGRLRMVLTVLRTI